MNNSNLTIIKELVVKKESIDPASIEQLLDVIASILAEEYIATVRQNPEIFNNGIPSLKQG